MTPVTLGRTVHALKVHQAHTAGQYLKGGLPSSFTFHRHQGTIHTDCMCACSRHSRTKRLQVGSMDWRSHHAIHLKSVYHACPVQPGLFMACGGASIGAPQSHGQPCPSSRVQHARPRTTIYHTNKAHMMMQIVALELHCLPR